MPEKVHTIWLHFGHLKETQDQKNFKDCMLHHIWEKYQVVTLQMRLMQITAHKPKKSQSTVAIVWSTDSNEPTGPKKLSLVRINSSQEYRDGYRFRAAFQLVKSYPEQVRQRIASAHSCSVYPAQHLQPYLPKLLWPFGPFVWNCALDT